MNYGLNNNTGTTTNYSNSNFSKVKKQITSSIGKASDSAKTISESMDMLKQWQNAKSGGDKMKVIASILAKIFAGS